jgi:hypothetical protein
MLARDARRPCVLKVRNGCKCADDGAGGARVAADALAGIVSAELTAGLVAARIAFTHTESPLLFRNVGVDKKWRLHPEG